MSYGVYFGLDRIGTLKARRAQLRFQYLGTVAAAGGPALSVRLPSREASYPHEEANPYFANLLPEDEHRRLLARSLGMSDRNVAGLLGAVGGECAGAVSIWPEGEGPPVPPQYVSLDDAEIRRLLAATGAPERLQAVRESRLSLAGGMEKLGLRLLDGRWQRGRGGAHTTHILKWAPPSIPDLNHNELFCMELCREAGLPVAEVTLGAVGTPVLIVRRYDRHETIDGTIAPLHQEDFCQAFGAEPGEKYQAEGGPGFADCAAVLRNYATVPARELPWLLRWGIASYLLGNADAHGKNLSLLYTPEGLRLAPFYDLACVLAYRGLSRKLAMAIGGEYRFAYLRARHWERFAADVGVPFAVVRREAIALAERIENALPIVKERVVAEHNDHPILSAVTKVVNRQVDTLRKHLA